MAENYDGWTIKVTWHKYPWLVHSFFRPTRSEVIQAIEEEWGEDWETERRKGNFKCVKVRLVEVEEKNESTR